MLVHLAVLLFFLLRITAADSPTPTNKTQNNDPFKINSAEFVQTSPIWLKDVKIPTVNVVKGYPRDEDVQEGPLQTGSIILDKDAYPVLNKQPPVDHPEVQAVLDVLDFSQIPPAPTRQVKNWVLDINDYSRTDPDCWWSASLCKKPKVTYIPEDISYCPNQGDWGLNYDDGPYKNLWPRTEKDKEFDQPRFYNFLLNKKKQKATLFFVGSNVVNFPEAAQRALNDGHTICSHTWSHPQMTSLTNEEVVAQLYWTQKAIKEAMGITPKCWRPPYGDVDDRVRAIAWQMGMRTILWDQDSNDWNLFVTEGRGHLKGEVIDGYFENWIKNRAAGNDTVHGHITLEHENSNVTITMSEKWLPKLQETFNVMPIHQCINDPKPYWEENWVYPTLEQPDVTRHSVPRVTPVTPQTTSGALPLATAKASLSIVFLMFVSFTIML